MHEAPAQTLDAEDAPPLRFLRSSADQQAAHVLVAGRDASERAAVLDELSETMPPSTVFDEAGAFSQLLERAHTSRLVVLSGELDDVAAVSLMGELANRHPHLSVVSLIA